MRNRGGGLEQDEAVIGRGDIHAAASEVVRESADVIDRIVPAKREFETVFAVLGSVAGSGVASQLGEHRHHVAHVVRLEIAANPGHANRKSGLLVFVENLELGLAILHWLDHAAFTDLDNIGVHLERKVTRGIVAFTVALHRCEQELVVVELAVQVDFRRLD